MVKLDKAQERRVPARRHDFLHGTLVDRWLFRFRERGPEMVILIKIHKSFEGEIAFYGMGLLFPLFPSFSKL